MFPNLKAEMARRDITFGTLAVVLHISPIIVERKLTGKKPLELDEAFKIRDFIDPTFDLTWLFAKA